MNNSQGVPANDNDSRKGFLRSVPIGPDFIKFFASAGTAAAFLVGFSYINEYLLHFGISYFDLDIGYLETVGAAVYLLQEHWVLLVTGSVVMLISVAVAALRYFLGNLGFYVSAAVFFLLVCYGAVSLGRVKAAEHSELIIEGRGGRTAYCKLKDGFEGSDGDIARSPQVFVQNFDKLTNAHRVVKIIETKESIYLFFVPKPGEIPEGYHGESISFQKTDLQYCRAMGDSSSKAIVRDVSQGIVREEGESPETPDCSPQVDPDCIGQPPKEERPSDKAYSIGIEMMEE